MYTFDDLVGIMAELWLLEGCPWDRGRAFESLKKCLADEAEGVFQAIDSKDMESLCEEPGNVLFQVVPNNRIAREKDRFMIDDVTDGLRRKMARRHLHVFDGVKMNSVKEGATLWNQIKTQEKVKKP